MDNIFEGNKKELEELQRILGLKIKNYKLLNQALTHTSYFKETDQTKITPNRQRLEFLGDSIINFWVSEYLYDKYPLYDEGMLSQIKSQIISRLTLAAVARQINLGKYLHLSKSEDESGGREKTSILGESFESLVAAIYLSEGIRSVKKLLKKYLSPLICSQAERKNICDYKTLLQEHIQKKFKALPVYKVIKEEGPDHQKKFYVYVRFKQKILGKGEGYSKKQAEQMAAQLALRNLKILK